MPLAVTRPPRAALEAGRHQRHALRIEAGQSGERSQRIRGEHVRIAALEIATDLERVGAVLSVDHQGPPRGRSLASP